MESDLIWLSRIGNREMSLFHIKTSVKVLVMALKSPSKCQKDNVRKHSKRRGGHTFSIMRFYIMPWLAGRSGNSLTETDWIEFVNWTTLANQKNKLLFFFKVYCPSFWCWRKMFTKKNIRQSSRHIFFYRAGALIYSSSFLASISSPVGYLKPACIFRVITFYLNWLCCE